MPARRQAVHPAAHGEPRRPAERAGRARPDGTAGDGGGVGPPALGRGRYRSAIFPTSAEQARVAKAYIAQLNQARVYNAAIVTKIEPIGNSMRPRITAARLCASRGAPGARRTRPAERATEDHAVHGDCPADQCRDGRVTGSWQLDCAAATETALAGASGGKATEN
jgi:Peptide methionine sulfoxide reductase